MSERRQRVKKLLDGFDEETRLELMTMAREEVVSEVKQAAHAFLSGLDSTDRSRLKQLGVAAYDFYVTELPGPNQFVKSKLRPGVELAIENAIADWCS